MNEKNVQHKTLKGMPHSNQLPHRRTLDASNRNLPASSIAHNTCNSSLSPLAAVIRYLSITSEGVVLMAVMFGSLDDSKANSEAALLLVDICSESPTVFNERIRPCKGI